MAQSPYLPSVRILAGLSGPTVAADIWHIGDPVRGKIGTAKIGSDDIWVDVTEWVRSWSFRRGANRTGIETRYEAGTCTVDLNNGDRRFDPTNLAGPYAPGSVTTLKPMTRVRILADWAGVSYPLFTGLADAYRPDYNQPTWSTTELTATDAFKVFAGWKNRPAVGIVGSGEDSGARINRVLSSLGWPVEDRNVSTGKSPMQGTTLTGNGLAELQLVQDSEMGEFYMDALGEAVFRHRQAIFQDTRSNTAQAVFGDDGIDDGEIPYVSVSVPTDDDTLVNRVTATIEGGTEQLAEDLVSQGEYLVKDYSKSGLLLQTDAEALSYAQAVLASHKDPDLRFDAITFGVPEPAAQNAAWLALLPRELGDRITVIRRPPGGGDPNERDCWVRGISMASDGEKWDTAWQLETVTRLNFWTIGHPTLGRIGVNAIAF